MRFNHLQSWRIIILIFGILSISKAAIEPNNGNFELGDFNEILNINYPAGWFHDANYAAIVTHFTPPTSERWKITNDLLPFDGNSFVVLSTGPEGVVTPDPNYVRIWQTITVSQGDKLTGMFFFGTTDYILSGYFNDWAEIKIDHHTDPNLNRMIQRVSIEEVGSHSSMSGWKKFEHIFEANEAGNYTLVIRVCDYQDSILPSYLAVDSLVLCRNPSDEGDFNADCIVNFEDFAFFAADWMCNCRDPAIHNDPAADPNYYNDIESNCLLGTDLDDSGPVDINDIKIMSEGWLDGIKEE